MGRGKGSIPWNKGKIGLVKHSLETRAKMRLSHVGNHANEKNCHWSGDNIGYKGVHTWVRKHLSRSNLCQMCNREPSLDLANVTGVYARDFSNWQYLCRKCHMISDGRIQKLQLVNFHSKPYRRQKKTV